MESNNLIVQACRYSAMTNQEFKLEQCPLVLYRQTQTNLIYYLSERGSKTTKKRIITRDVSEFILNKLLLCKKSDATIRDWCVHTNLWEE